MTRGSKRSQNSGKVRLARTDGQRVTARDNVFVRGLNFLRKRWLNRRNERLAERKKEEVVEEPLPRPCLVKIRAWFEGKVKAAKKHQLLSCFPGESYETWETKIEPFEPCEEPGHGKPGPSKPRLKMVEVKTLTLVDDTDLDDDIELIPLESPNPGCFRSIPVKEKIKQSPKLHPIQNAVESDDSKHAAVVDGQENDSEEDEAGPGQSNALPPATVEPPFEEIQARIGNPMTLKKVFLRRVLNLNEPRRPEFPGAYFVDGAPRRPPSPPVLSQMEERDAVERMIRRLIYGLTDRATDICITREVQARQMQLCQVGGKPSPVHVEQLECQDFEGVERISHQEVDEPHLVEGLQPSKPQEGEQQEERADGSESDDEYWMDSEEEEPTPEELAIQERNDLLYEKLREFAESGEQERLAELLAKAKLPVGVVPQYLREAAKIPRLNLADVESEEQTDADMPPGNRPNPPEEQPANKGIVACNIPRPQAENVLLVDDIPSAMRPDTPFEFPPRPLIERIPAPLDLDPFFSVVLLPPLNPPAEIDYGFWPGENEQEQIMMRNHFRPRIVKCDILCAPDKQFNQSFLFYAHTMAFGGCQCGLCKHRLSTGEDATIYCNGIDIRTMVMNGICHALQQIRQKSPIFKVRQLCPPRVCVISCGYDGPNANLWTPPVELETSAVIGYRRIYSEPNSPQWITGIPDQEEAEAVLYRKHHRRSSLEDWFKPTKPRELRPIPMHEQIESANERWERAYGGDAGGEKRCDAASCEIKGLDQESECKADERNLADVAIDGNARSQPVAQNKDAGINQHHRVNSPAIGKKRQVCSLPAIAEEPALVGTPQRPKTGKPTVKPRKVQGLKCKMPYISTGPAACKGKGVVSKKPATSTGPAVTKTARGGKIGTGKVMPAGNAGLVASKSAAAKVKTSNIPSAKLNNSQARKPFTGKQRSGVCKASTIKQKKPKAFQPVRPRHPFLSQAPIKPFHLSNPRRSPVKRAPKATTRQVPWNKSQPRPKTSRGRKAKSTIPQIAQERSPEGSSPRRVTFASPISVVNSDLESDRPVVYSADDQHSEGQGGKDLRCAMRC